MLASIFTFLVLQYAPEKRMMVLLLVTATTFLTCSSLAGYWFLQMYSGAVLSFSGSLKGRAIALVLAAISFGVSFGSGALLGYLLSRV